MRFTSYLHVYIRTYAYVDSKVNRSCVACLMEMLVNPACIDEATKFCYMPAYMDLER